MRLGSGSPRAPRGPGPRRSALGTPREAGTTAIIPTREAFEELNPAYYAGRRGREAKRDALNEALATEIATAVEDIKAAKARLEALVGYGEPGSVIRYRMEV